MRISVSGMGLEGGEIAESNEVHGWSPAMGQAGTVMMKDGPWAYWCKDGAELNMARMSSVRQFTRSDRHTTDLQGSCRSGPWLSLRSGQCGDLILVAGRRVVRGPDTFDAEI